MEACLRGERRAQERLFQTYYGKMLAVCMRYLSDRDSAQEILQVSFLKVFDKLEFFDFTGSLEGWIRRIVTNTAIDHLRKAKKDPFLSDQDNDFVTGSSDPMVESEQIALLDLKAQVAIEAIGKLSPAYRAVFNLYVIEEHTHKEIAEILEIPLGTVMSRLHRGRKAMQKMLYEYAKERGLINEALLSQGDDE